MDGCKVDEEHVLDDADIRMILANRLLDDPLENVVLGTVHEQTLSSQR